MLLLALLVTLLAAERRAELGMSRALGLQRSHLALQLLFEGAGYGLVAVVIGENLHGWEVGSRDGSQAGNHNAAAPEMVLAP